MDRDGEDVPLLRERAASYADSGHAGSEESVDQRGATVSCRVCDAVIELEGRSQQHVVKCGACHEATPIRPAPPGKKYVRCPCNCLLICKAASTRIACPRTNCRRVITLGHREPQGSATRAPAGFCRVSCGYCNEVFMFNTLSNTLAQCPHCKRRSTVGTFAGKRARLFLVMSVLVLICSILFTVFTASKAAEYKIIYVAYALIYTATAAGFFQAVRYHLTKGSNIIGPV